MELETTSEVSSKSLLCMDSYTIGLVDMSFMRDKELSLENSKSYLIACNSLKSNPDIELLNYIKKQYDYKFEDGKHSVT